MESANHMFINVRRKKDRRITAQYRRYLAKGLIQQLRELERDGLVRRQVYQQMPPKVEYSLTEYGVTANKIVDVMCTWGRENIALWQQQGEEIILAENKEPAF